MSLQTLAFKMMGIEHKTTRSQKSSKAKGERKGLFTGRSVPRVTEQASRSIWDAQFTASMPR